MIFLVDRVCVKLKVPNIFLSTDFFLSLTYCHLLLLLTLFLRAPVSGGCILPWCPVQCVLHFWTNKLIDWLISESLCIKRHYVITLAVTMLRLWLSFRALFNLLFYFVWYFCVSLYDFHVNKINAILLRTVCPCLWVCIGLVGWNKRIHSFVRSIYSP